MARKKHILFISLNAHQKRYFRQLGKNLSSEYQVYYVHYAWANATNAFLPRAEIPGELQIAEQEIQEIVKFIHLKTEARGNGFFSRFFAGDDVLRKQAAAAIRYFYDYLRTKDIDLICVWNGTLIPLAAAALVAKKLARRTLFFENGYLPGTTTVDPAGVNNCSSLVGKTRDFYERQTIDQSRLANSYRRSPEIRELKSKWYQKLLTRKKVGEPEKIVLPKQFVFLPLQVHDDTQILLHSKLRTMEQFLDFVIPAVEIYNEQHGANLHVVVKEHPSDFGRVDYSGLKAKYNRAQVAFLRFFPTPTLIEKAAGVITINSSVGIEALLKHKPVITLGRAFYNVSGLVHHVQSPQELIQALDMVHEQKVNHALIDKFIYFLRYTYLAEGSWRNPDVEHYESVRSKIADLLGN